MKQILLIVVFCLLVSFETKAQQAPSTDIHATVDNMYLTNLNGRPWAEVKYGSIEGIPFLTEGWPKGWVRVNKNRIFRDVPLRFDAYSNKLYFKKDSTEFEFVLPVSEFCISYKEDRPNDSSVFRNGYPAIDRNNEETFYEVMVDGKFQLLSFVSKVIESFTGYNTPATKRFALYSQLYALLPNGSIVKLKYGTDKMMAAMPAYADAIKSITDKNKLKLKNDEQVVELFKRLNQ
jgi:hypothetical protein